MGDVSDGSTDFAIDDPEEFDFVTQGHEAAEVMAHAHKTLQVRTWARTAFLIAFQRHDTKREIDDDFSFSTDTPVAHTLVC